LYSKILGIDVQYGASMANDTPKSGQFREIVIATLSQASSEIVDLDKDVGDFLWMMAEGIKNTILNNEIFTVPNRYWV
jgi:hypothetical protein